MEANKSAADTTKFVDECILMLHTSRLFTSTISDESLVGILNDGLASEDAVWQCKCKIAKHVIDKDKENATNSIRDL